MSTGNGGGAATVARPGTAAVLVRLLRQQLAAVRSLAPWAARQGHRLPPGSRAASYTEPQTATLYTLLGVSVVEAGLFALIIPWPVLHAVVLAVHVLGVLLILALQAACVTRPHVAGPDGSLRLRYGTLFDLRVPAALVERARVERRMCEGTLTHRPEGGDGGVLELAVGSQTTVTVELAEPVEFVRPLGGRGTARVLHFQADDPAALVAALNAPAEGRAAPPADRN